MIFNALRRGRFSEANRAYLVTAVTRHRLPVFTELRACRLLIREMRALHEDAVVESIAWVVMPDHLHWLFRLGDRLDLGQAINILKGRSSRAINRHLGRKGSLWQRAFHDHALRDEEDLHEMAAYVVDNPLRAGLCESIREYPHWDAAWI